MIDPSLEGILAPTYGIMLYQEQVMQVAQTFAGFSLGKADILRRAMGKKNVAEMHRMEDDFIKGLSRLGTVQKKPSKSLPLWKNCVAMASTVPMPMPTQPWPSNWLTLKSIIQMSF